MRASEYDMWHLPREADPLWRLTVGDTPASIDETFVKAAREMDTRWTILLEALRDVYPNEASILN